MNCPVGRAEISGIMKSRPVDTFSGARALRRTAVVAAVSLAAVMPYSQSSSAATPGVVAGTVYYDVNNDGVRGLDEQGVAGVVVNAYGPGVVTDINGNWTMSVPSRVLKVRVSTGWYRSQCDSLDCPSGPGTDNNFEVANQFITATVDGAVGAKLNVGLLPDWPGEYPIPPAPAAANEIDIATRLSWIWPTSPGNCYRTNDPRHHGCAVGDTPTGALQVSNEGTAPLTGISGFIEVPPNTTILPAIASSSPGNSPDITDLIIGPTDPLTNRAPFELVGTLAPAAAAQYILTARIEPGTPPSPLPLRTSNPYVPNEMTITITNPVDPDGCLVEPCPRGQHNKQAPADNTDFHGWQVVSAFVTPTPAVADFGALPQGIVGSASVSLRNLGTADALVNDVSVAGAAAADFTVADATACTSAPLAPGSTCLVVLAFAPTITGLRTASMVAHSLNAPDVTVGLSGRRALPLPTITSINPAGAKPGATVTFTGTNFASPAGPTTVKFTGSVAAPVVPSADGTTIVVSVPAAAQQGAVTITTDAGSVNSAVFVVRRPPADLVPSPTSGAVGTVVTIKGNNLKGTTEVRFNGLTTKFTVLGPNKLTAIVPVGATTGSIKVVNPWGSALTAAIFTVTPAP